MTPQLSFRKVESGLDGEDSAFVERLGVLPGAVDVDADEVADAVHHALPKRLAVQIFAVLVDVVEGEWCRGSRPVVLGVVDLRFAGDEGCCRGAPGSENNV